MEGSKRQQRKAAAWKRYQEKEWYVVRSIFGNTWAHTFILLGGRERGKSYSVMEFFLKDWKVHKRPFTWLRLKESATKLLLANNAYDFVDRDLVRRFDLDLKVHGNMVYDHGEPMARILALSTFYNTKGVALFDNSFDDWYNICLDEVNYEVGEKRSVANLAYAFVNQIENILRSTKDKIRVVIIGNSTDACPDILSLFNFMPQTWGRFKLRSKKTVIDNIPNSEAYNRRRKDSYANMLMGDASTFTNLIEEDEALIFKKTLHKPSAIIQFDKKLKFTLWDSKVIKEYKNERNLPVIAMRPYQDAVFDPKRRDAVFALYDSRSLLFRDLITMKRFRQQLMFIKPRNG